MKTKYPIIVQKVNRNDPDRSVGEQEKFYKIYCLACDVNAFNEVIEVWYTTRSIMSNKREWSVSKGSSGSQDLEGCKLIAEGYQIATKLMQGDESVVSPQPLVDKFLKAYWAKVKRREKSRWEARRKVA